MTLLDKSKWTGADSETPQQSPYHDYEIIGYDPDCGRDTNGNPVGSLILWDALGDTIPGIPGPYTSGETPEDYGLDNLTGREMAAILRGGWQPKESN